MLSNQVPSNQILIYQVKENVWDYKLDYRVPMHEVPSIIGVLSQITLQVCIPLGREMKVDSIKFRDNTHLAQYRVPKETKE